MAQLFGLARIGRDVELRYTQQGDAVASVSLAFNYGRKGQDGNRPTQWVDGSLWGQRAEGLAQHLIKGTQVSVTLDDVHIETFQKQDGTQGHKLAGRISALEFASSPQQAQQPAQQQFAQQRAQAPQRPAPPPQRPAQNQYPQQSGGGFSDMDDSIPF